MVELLHYWWLVPVVFGTAVMTSAIGAGGGTLLLAFMGLVLPPMAVLPLHGAIMGVQNGFRGILLWRQIDWRFVVMAVAGSLVGASLAGPLVVQVPDSQMRIVLALGLLYLVWAPKPSKPLNIPWLSQDARVALMAFLLATVTMIIGASGVLFSAIRRRSGRSKEGILADQSLVMVVQHFMKVLVFGLAGFMFGPYLLLLGVMMLAGLAGTFVGVYFLKTMDSPLFDKFFRGAVTFVALVIIWKVLF